MNTKDKIGYIIICIFIFHSCSNPNSLDKKQLGKIDFFLEEYPDSALLLLKSLEKSDVNKFSEEEYNKYFLLRTIAKDKNDLDISVDTILFNVTTYYHIKNDLYNEIRSLFYSGRVSQVKGDYEEAMIYYLKAENLALKLEGNSKLKGFIESYIGDLLLDELSVREAIKRYKKALIYFNSSGSHRNEIITYNQIGICYSINEFAIDSSAYYFQKGINLADKIADRNLQMTSRHNLGLTWEGASQPDSSIFYLHKALKYSNDEKDTLKIYFNIARIYSDYNIDSTGYYINQIEKLNIEKSDYYIVESINSLKSKILKQTGDYEEALLLLENFIIYMHNKFDSYKDKQILEIQEKYNFERQENENHERLIFWQRLLIGLLILVILFIVIGVFLFIKSKNNEKALEEANEKIALFDEMVEIYNKKEDTLKSTLLRHFDILKKAALVDIFLKKGIKIMGKRFLKNSTKLFMDKKNLIGIYCMIL